MYTGVSRVSSSQILRGLPYGGTAVLFKTSLAQYVTPINCKNKRVSGVKICIDNSFTCLLLSVYMPCDNHSNVVNQQYVEVIDCIEIIFNSFDFNPFIVCGINHVNRHCSGILYGSKQVVQITDIFIIFSLNIIGLHVEYYISFYVTYYCQ